MSDSVPSDYVKHLEGLRIRAQDRLIEATIRWVELANKRLAELSRHLFAIAVVVFPLSLLPLTAERFDLDIPFLGKYCLILAWFSFFLSMVSGLVHLFKESRYYSDWGQQELDRSFEYKASFYSESDDAAHDRFTKMNAASVALQKMPVKSDLTWIQLQAGFLVCGILMIGGVLITKVLSIGDWWELCRVVWWLW